MDYFFFFQAEDGIRDDLVTGVQTCALPISAGLGPDFVAKGCRAYFGYSDNFTYPPNLAEVFFDCDSEIDRGFANGLTADQVFQNVLARFQQHIDQLKSTGDSGDLFNASVLEVDLRLLRAPSVAVEYGDPSAKLDA